MKDVNHSKVVNCSAVHSEEGTLCEVHHLEKLRRNFETAYNSCLPVVQPLGKMRTLMGRMLEEVWRVDGGSLTISCMRNRAFNFKKDGRGFTFEITQFPVEPEGKYGKRLIKKWKVDVTYGRAKMVSERAWRPYDFDGSGG